MEASSDIFKKLSQDILFSELLVTVWIPASAALAVIFGAWLWWRVSFITVKPGQNVLRSENGREYLLEEEQRGEDEVRWRLPRGSPRGAGCPYDGTFIGNNCIG
jgi:hypothetical protein